MSGKRKPHKETEGEVEECVVQQARGAGGIAFKFTSPGRRSVPDRFILLPGGVWFLIECKAERCKPTALQRAEHERLRKLAARVYVCDTRAAVRKVFEYEFKTPAARTEISAGLALL
jgi:hypothetical protein